MKYAVIVPTLNAAKEWRDFSHSLLENTPCETVLVIDSESTDTSVALARASGIRVHGILRREFDHGATRQLAVDLVPDVDILVFLTQDAVIAGSDSIRNLLRSFEDPEVGAAYGRQLPRFDSRPIEAHARLFNYPAVSVLRDYSSRKDLGFKTIFISNSLPPTVCLR